jgi:uncharacterized protein YukE
MDMKSVSKVVRAELARAEDDVRDAAEKVRDAESRLAKAVAEAQAVAESVAAEVERYNEAVERFNEQIDGILEAIDAYVAERSDRWREGEAADRYATWREMLESAKIEPVEAIEIEDAPEIDDLAEEIEIPPLALDEV